jgi:UDP-GlcNAc:undecaprenyl-phosphate GlcNAc-1-phosphate transferase
MDGLAAGVCLIAALAMAGCCIGEVGGIAAPAALALAGGCAGFLIYNFNPAKIFMGDCGSMFLGFSLAALAVQGTQRSASHLALSLFVPVAILAIPIFDTTLVSITRTLHGRSISQGGRDHSSHRLVDLGLSERGTVVVLYALTALFGGLALLATQLPLLVVGLLALLLFSALMVLGFYLGYLRIYPEEARVPEHIRIIGGHILFKRQLVQVILDLQLVPVAFVGAHLLRHEGVLMGVTRDAVLAALPIVVVAKLVGMALCRAYRGVWRYAGVSDAMAALSGSTVGSLLALVALAVVFQLREISRAALIIDWLMFTLLAVAARTGYVALRQLFGMLPAHDGPRVVILGAEAEAYALVRKLRDPLSPRRAHVVGILDDDPDKQGRTLNGVPVLGPVSTFSTVLEEKRVECCLLGVSPYSKAGRRILSYCGERRIDVYSDLEPASLIPSEKNGAHATG